MSKQRSSEDLSCFSEMSFLSKSANETSFSLNSEHNAGSEPESNFWDFRSFKVRWITSKTGTILNSVSLKETWKDIKIDVFLF